jgi:hypothetical protein
VIGDRPDRTPVGRDPDRCFHETAYDGDPEQQRPDGQIRREGVKVRPVQFPNQQVQRDSGHEYQPADRIPESGDDGAGIPR